MKKQRKVKVDGVRPIANDKLVQVNGGNGGGGTGLPPVPHPSV